MKTIHNFDEYLRQVEEAKANPTQYWGEVARDLEWFKPWDQVSSGNFSELNIKWFEGATTNMSTNCLDRHLKTRGHQTALIYVANDPKQAPLKINYLELHQKVCRMASVFTNLGIKKGDVICFYMGMVPELMIGILAATRIGAIHSVVFGGFSAQSLAGRIQDCEAKLLVTNDGGHRGDKIIPLKQVCDEALKECPSIKTVIVHRRTKNNISMTEDRDFWLHDLETTATTVLPATPMKSEDPLFILYTSGSTGRPKGLMHTTGGYMVYAYHTFRNVFQMKAEDIFWCTADIGWVTGHTYLTYGPLLNGNTTVMYEGLPVYPDAGRFWNIIDQLKVTHFYTAPTAIRALQAMDLSFVSKYKLDSLKVLGSVGEPINEEAWEWYHRNIGKGRCPIVDTWWQTETGGIMISPLAHVTECIPAHATYPLPGISPILVDSSGKEITEIEAEGNLCIKSPWPGIARTVWGDHERYRHTYFGSYPGMYFTGDGARRDSRGNYRITGRVDDVINVSGHRLGTAEIEDAINTHPDIVESAVVGYPHKIKGQGIYAFCICPHALESPEQVRQELIAAVNKVIGPIAKPDLIQFVTGLPKTRSGKIMRRILRKVGEGDVSNLGDTSTLLNPEVVDEIVKGKLR
ncbi:MAG: acetate--CoA ligase [Bdellovibrionales bacterium GWA2_49_15]|nr:MAG: acetate--CoA ligase [Bdellovibrionales bacterium GWA2_49_15]